VTTRPATRPATALRVAGAPISWGVCEVPGWGAQLPPDVVLAQMREVGLTATEFGPDGFLPADPARRAALLRRYRLEPVGGFVPVLLHEPGADARIDQALDDLAAAGGRVLVLAAATGTDGYETRPELGPAAWAVLLRTLDRAAARAADRGLIATLHPHVGTHVERPDEVRRVLDGSVIGLCLDSGHLLIGGTDPVALATEAAGRIAHVHLKDVDATIAAQVRSGSSYSTAIIKGLYRPLGRGDVGIATLVTTLVNAGYDGWFVLEQDTVLPDPVGSEPGPSEPGPAADVRASLAYLRSLSSGALSSGALSSEALSFGAPR
jgi:inosose dehydratase